MNKIISILVLSLLSLLSLTTLAVPAKRGIWRELQLSDGSSVRTELFGDERMHYWVSKEKQIYVPSGKTFMRIDGSELRSRIASAQRNFSVSASNDIMKSPSRPQKALTYVGSKKCLIILVQFSDMAFSMADPKAFYNRVANELSFNEGNFRGSLKDYFLEQSNNQFDLTFDIAGPYTLSNYAAYGANTSSGGVDTQKAQLMISQACAAAEQDGVDFRPYDWDNDGNVEEVYVLYAGKGEADGGDENTLWPHKFQIPSTSYGGARVSVYACSNEINGRGQVAGIGTICHEFSHCLGFPDMYDIDYAENGNQYGMGSWDLMCSGSYNANGYIPAGYTAYEKMVAGWITPIDLSNVSTLNVSGMKSIADGGDAYIMYNPANHNEYYIWENRQQKGFDASLPASGIMIHHIDYNAYVWATNGPNTISSTNDHERITFIPADNSRTSTTEHGDTWPYSNNTMLSNGTRPADEVFTANNGTKYMNIVISGMSVINGEASFNFSNLNTSHSEQGFLLHETFSKCAGSGGNDGNFGAPTLRYTNGEFTPDIEGWNVTNAFGGTMCARFGTTQGRFGTTVLPGSATSPTFTLNGTTTLTFKAAPMGDDATTLTVGINGTEATIDQQTFNMKKGEWTDFTANITAAGEISLSFSSQGRFFLDEVYVPENSIPAGIDAIKQSSTITSDNIEAPLYNLAGQRVASSYKGIVIQNGKKFMK